MGVFVGFVAGEGGGWFVVFSFCFSTSLACRPMTSLLYLLFFSFFLSNVYLLWFLLFVLPFFLCFCICFFFLSCFVFVSHFFGSFLIGYFSFFQFFCFFFFFFCFTHPPMRAPKANEDIFLHGPESAHKNGIVKTFTHTSIPTHPCTHLKEEKKRNKMKRSTHQTWCLPLLVLFLSGVLVIDFQEAWHLLHFGGLVAYDCCNRKHLWKGSANTST